MASLFNILLRLQSRYSDRTPLEDYFTELVAYLLQDAPEILTALLRRFELTKLPEPMLASIATQVNYERLDGHEMDSRPDLVVKLQAEHTQGLVFIESKIGSTEGPKQLRRYAEHLAAHTEIAERTLVFITRDYEPKNATKLLVGLEVAAIRFVQLRWYEVYYFLKKNFAANWLACEVCRFMEKNRMEQALQFNPVDLLALTNFRQAKAMMDQSLNGPVMRRLQQFGGEKIKFDLAIEQFERHNRYIIILRQLNGLWAGIGYFMPTEDPFGYPEIGLMLEVNTKAAGQPQDIVKAMQEVVAAQPQEWKDYNQPMTRQWVNIYRRQPLQDFLQGPDHQQKVRAYLLECIEALDIIRSRYPQLSWAKQPFIGTAPSLQQPIDADDELG
jgi:hypothetical protein